MTLAGRKILFLVSEDWYFCSHRLPLAKAAKEAGAEIVVATRVADHAAPIEEAGLRLVPISLARGGRNPLHDMKTIAELIRLYRRERPDLVHHVALKPILYGCFAAAFSGVPTVVNAVAGMGFTFVSEDLFAQALRPVVRAAFRRLMNRPRTRTIVQNPDDLRLLVEEAGVAPERLVVIRGSGVDVARLRPQPEPAGPPVAVCVSRMLWDKGIGELVEAARRLRADGVPLTVRLVGPTDQNPASIPEATLKRWAAEGIVEVAGPTQDVAGTYAKAHIAVLASYREGLPKSLLEAAACGRALVASDVPGCREICRDGETGLLVAPRSAAELAVALKRLVRDAGLRRRLGTNARRLAERAFAVEIVVRETLKLYEEMLDDAKVPLPR